MSMEQSAFLNRWVDNKRISSMMHVLLAQYALAHG